MHFISLLSTYLYIYDTCTFTRIDVKISVHHASRFTDKNGILIFMVLCYEEILFRITPSTGTEGRVWRTEHFDVGPVRVLPARFPRLYTTLHLRSLNCTIIRGDIQQLKYLPSRTHQRVAFTNFRRRLKIISDNEEKNLLPWSLHNP